MFLKYSIFLIYLQIHIWKKKNFKAFYSFNLIIAPPRWVKIDTVYHCLVFLLKPWVTGALLYLTLFFFAKEMLGVPFKIIFMGYTRGYRIGFQLLWEL